MAQAKSRVQRNRSNLPGRTDKRIDALLSLLSENTTIVISGAQIAKEIGVRRQTVWRWIEILRAAGVKVKGHPRTGYHIERAADVLAPKLLARGLRGTPFAKHIFHFFKVDSTNTVAMRLGDEGEAHGAVVVAEEQTSGRGRAGHSWHSEKAAGIYASILLRPHISPMLAPALTLVAGLAAYDAISEEGGLRPDIRWPNDVLLKGKKVCGILTEMQAEPDRMHFAVIGIGINVNQPKMPGELANIATSMRIETGRMHSRLELIARLLRHLDRYYNQFVAEGTAPILKRFADVSSYFEGKRVRISTSAESFVGTTAGLESMGILRVKRDDGRIETVISGTVSEAE
ncbi:MAG TPA: biotin--[acetyl-CoA-carboxylase] ligase [Candidatus Acidoferrales bacterium]|nr:biotin--[acetyl-CoA-carboxylase] ligase [Candidatus Acidoferrales bacterium]